MYRYYVCACVPSFFSHVQLFATQWTIAHQAPLSKGFSRQEHQSELPWSPPGDLSDPGIEPASLHLLHWQAGSSSLVPPGRAVQLLLILKPVGGKGILQGISANVQYIQEFHKLKYICESEVTQLCPTLCDPMDCSLPGFSLHRIFQAKCSGVGCHFLLQRYMYIYMHKHTHTYIYVSITYEYISYRA